METISYFVHYPELHKYFAVRTSRKPVPGSDVVVDEFPETEYVPLKKKYPHARWISKKQVLGYVHEQALSVHFQTGEFFQLHYKKAAV